jgi:DNA-directed RNA polymerase specialized sigma24 family protein
MSTKQDKARPSMLSADEVARYRRWLVGTDPHKRLQAIAKLRAMLHHIEESSVAACREAGYEWAEIGDALGISKQAVWQRWGRAVDNRDTKPKRS